MSEEQQQPERAKKRVYQCTVGEDVCYVKAATKTTAENWLARKLLAEQKQTISTRAATVDDVCGGVEIWNTDQPTEEVQ